MEMLWDNCLTENTVALAKRFCFFLRADEYGSCKVRINKSKAINRGDGMEIECTLEFIGQRRFIDILKGNLKD